MAYASDGTNYYHGFPTPGAQNPSVTEVMDHIFFASESDWKQCREDIVWDYVVIGSGFCSYAFVERIIKKALEEACPNQRNPRIPYILILERGGFYYPEHFQNLPNAFALGPDQKFMNETFPWTLALKSATMKITNGATPVEHNDKGATWQHGMVPFFGGRSTLWSAWCPVPEIDKPENNELHGWPEEMLEIMRRPNFFKDAEELLGVCSTDKLADKYIEREIPKCYRIYGTLQHELSKKLTEEIKPTIPSVTRTESAPLAVVDVNGLYTSPFEKFSVVGPFMKLLSDYRRKYDPSNRMGKVTCVTHCVVNRILYDDECGDNGEPFPTALETSRGVLPVGRNTRIIIAAGCMPAATLLLNSYPKEKIPHVGSRFSAHFISAITARIPKKAFPFANQLQPFEQAALYLGGTDRATKLTYHAQISILYDHDPVKYHAVALKYMPDVVSTASMDQLMGSKDHVVFVYAVLGELDTENKNNNFTLKDPDAVDKSCNCKLSYTVNDNDQRLWTLMEQDSFKALEGFAGEAFKDEIEYWNFSLRDMSQQGHWQKEHFAFRVPGMVHESSVVPMGPRDSAAVGYDFRPYGTHNVYVTGAGLWPTGPSWNPTMTMVSFAQSLADNLASEIRMSDRN